MSRLTSSVAEAGSDCREAAEGLEANQPVADPRHFHGFPSLREACLPRNMKHPA